MACETRAMLTYGMFRHVLAGGWYAGSAVNTQETPKNVLMWHACNHLNGSITAVLMYAIRLSQGSNARSC